MLPYSVRGEQMSVESSLVAELEGHFRLIDQACYQYGVGATDAYNTYIQTAGDMLAAICAPSSPAAATDVPHDTPWHDKAVAADEDIFRSEEDFAPPPTFLKIALELSRDTPDISSLIPPPKPLPTQEEMIATLEANKLTRERRELIMFGAVLATGALAVTTMLSMTPTAKSLSEILRPSTATEVAISDTLEEALGSSVIVRCLSKDDLSHLPGSSSSSGKALPYSRILLVNTRSCNEFAEYIQNPVSYEQAKQDPAAKKRLEAIALATNVIAHEHTHAVGGKINESETQCEAIPKISKILAAIADDAHPSGDFVNLATTAVKEFMDGATQDHPDYAVDPSCYDGLLNKS